MEFFFIRKISRTLDLSLDEIGKKVAPKNLKFPLVSLLVFDLGLFLATNCQKELY